MTTRTTALSVWVFDTPDGAEAALRGLDRRQVQGRVAVADVAVATWEPGAVRPRSYQAGTEAGAAALSGAFWGLLFGLAFLLPLTGAAPGAASGPGLERVGLGGDFLARVGDLVGAGTSALFLLSEQTELDRIGASFEREFAGPLLSLLDGPRRAALRDAFAADDLDAV